MATFIGTSGNDILNGTSSDDQFDGGGGSDIINGGAGLDTAVFHGPPSNFQISIVAGSPTVTVRDKVGSGGTASLAGIERVQITNTQVTDAVTQTNVKVLGDAPAMAMSNIYQTMAASIYASLNRAADAVGLNYWAGEMAAGKSLSEVSKGFFAAPEATAIYSPTASAASLVDAGYRNALGRAPDAAGAAYWTNEIQSGHIERSDFITALVAGAQSSDAQFVNNRAAASLHFALTQGLTNVAWARDVLSGVDASAASVAAANQKTDAYAAIAAQPATSELVVQVIGIAP